MGQVVYRANLSAPNFPMLSGNFGRTVIVKGQDQNYIGSSLLVSPADADKDVGVSYKRPLRQATATGCATPNCCRSSWGAL